MATFVNLPTPAANGAGAAVDASGLAATKTLLYGGTPGNAAQVTIEISNDLAGTNFTPIHTFQAPGEYTLSVVARWMRAVVSNYRGAGAPNVYVGAGDELASFATLVAPAASGLGAVVDTSGLPIYKTVQVTGAFRGTLNVLASEDGVDYQVVMSFSAAGAQSRSFTAQFLRVERVNAAGAVPEIEIAADTGGGGAGGGGGGYGPTYGLGPSNLGILQPAFVNPQVTTTIYARPGGSDITGDGKTVATAYGSFDRAWRDAPTLIPPGQRYNIDITDIDEDLADNYEMPTFKSPEENNYDPADPFFLYNAALQIIATPRVMNLAGGEATVPIADLTGTTIFDGSKLLELTFGTPRNTWDNNALKGKILSQDGHATPAAVAGTIFFSTPTTLLVSMTVAPTVDFTIREPSATLRVDSVPSASGDRGGLNIYNCDSIALQGIRILQRSSPAQSFGLVCTGKGQVVIQMCELQNAQVSSGSQNMTKMFNNWIYGERFRSSELLALVNILFDGIDQFALLNMQKLLLNRCGVFGENTGGTLEWLAQAPGTSRFGDLSVARIESTIIKDITAGGTPDGLRFNGGECVMVNVAIDGCGRDGIRGENNIGYLNMTNVRSTVPNGTVTNVNGVGDSFTEAVGIVTLSDAAALFKPDMVGKPVTIAGSTTPANDGTFIITSVNAAGTDITYANGAGVTEAFAGTWTVPTGVGIYLNDGIICRVDSQTSAAAPGTELTGAGGDMKVGSNPVRPWTDFVANDPIKNECDMRTPFVQNALSGLFTPAGDETTGVGTGGCSGSRLFQR